MLIVRTPVRISLAGGGTDFPSYYEAKGGMVLSTSIDKYFYTVLTEREDRQTQIISSDLKTLETCEQIEKMEFKGSDLEIPFAVLKYLRCDVGVNLFLASEVPPGTGLGSSAAVCVNVLKTLSVFLGQDLSEQVLAETAFHIARDILRRPVGKQDEYAVALGGLNVFKFQAYGVEVEPLRLPEELLLDLEQNLMLFFTGSSRDSSAILRGQDDSIQRREDEVLASLTKLKELVLPMRDALLRADLDAFAGLLDEGWMIKKRVSTKISNSRIDQIYQAAKSCGALGGKIAGAGGGGFLLLYCERENQAKVREGLRQFGLKEMAFHFDSGGAESSMMIPSSILIPAAACAGRLPPPWRQHAAGKDGFEVSGRFAKAFLLAAGLGTRLRPLTDNIPKCLAPIQGVPLLNIWLAICEQLGIEHVLVNTHHFAPAVRNWAVQQKSPVRISLFHEANLLGSAGTIAANRDFIGGDDDFFIFYADNLVRANFEPLKSFHLRHTGVLTIALFRSPKPENCGIVSVDESGRITSFEEKPVSPKCDLANSGIYIARRGLFEHLPPKPVMDFGKDVIPGLVGHAWGALLDGYILDVGTPENYQRAQEEWGTMECPINGECPPQQGKARV